MAGGTRDQEAEEAPGDKPGDLTAAEPDEEIPGPDSTGLTGAGEGLGGGVRASGGGCGKPCPPGLVPGQDFLYSAVLRLRSFLLLPA